MFDMLLALSIDCIETQKIISRMRNNEKVPEVIQKELVKELQESTPHCNWDAND